MSEPLRVLVIDDDRKIAHAICVRLRSAGYEVQTAYDGETGLTAVTEWIPQLIVLDIRMPKMNGLSLLMKLRECTQTERIPVIVLSACAVEEGKALDAGAFCFLAKPYDPPTLLRTVASALGPPPECVDRGGAGACGWGFRGPPLLS